MKTAQIGTKEIEVFIETKEIEVFKKDLNTAAGFVASLSITDEASYKSAIDTGRTVQETLKKVTARKEEITKPLNQALKSARDLFRPLETMAQEAIDGIKGKMLEYQREEARKAEIAKQKLMDRVDRGTMKVGTAVRKINEDIKAPEKTTEGELGSATVTKRKAYRVVDISKVPLEFMEVNMTMVKASFKAGKPVPGTEEYEEEDMRFNG